MQLNADIAVSEEQVELLNIAEDFCRDHSSIEKVRELIDDETGYDPDVWKQLGELGWLAIAIPEDYDGVGLSLAEVVPIVEQMGRRSLNSPFVSTTLAAQALMVGGSDAQKQDWLTKIAAGQAATVALSEDNGDWDLNAISSKGEKSGDQVFLTGKKIFVLNLPSAGPIVTSVKIDGESRLAILNGDDIPENAIRRERIIDDTKRSFELTLDGLSVGAGAVMDADKTQAALEHIHLAANLLGSAELCGACKATVDYTVEYLKTRRQFGKLIGSFQALKHPTVDAFVGYEQARSLLYSAAHCFNQQGQGEIATRMAKAQADKALSFAADRSIQFHGGFGFTYDCDAQLYRRNAIFQASQFGDAAYHRRKLADLMF